MTPPTEVTLPETVRSIVCALKTYQNELSALQLDTGGMLDEAEVTLVLEASAQRNGELAVDVKPTVSGFSAFGLTSTNKLENFGSRDNTIHLVFKHTYTANLNAEGKRPRSPLQAGSGCEAASGASPYRQDSRP